MADAILTALGNVEQAIKDLNADYRYWTAGDARRSGPLYSASATFSPAAASHTAGDVNGGMLEFKSLGSAGSPVMITSSSLLIVGGTAEATAWRLYVYDSPPVSAYADDAAFDLLTQDQGAFLGLVELGTAVDLGTAQWVEVNGINKQVRRLASGSMWGYLVNLTTVTPAAIPHIVTLHTAPVLG